MKPKCPRCRKRWKVEETTTVFDTERWFQCPRCKCRYREIDKYTGRKK